MSGKQQQPTWRAPAIGEKLAAATEELVKLEQRGAELVLEAAEGKAGADRLLTAHRDRAELAQKQVAELRGALVLAERLDREAAAAAAAKMRAEQLAAFKSAMSQREQAMTALLEAVASMAAAYGVYSQATLTAQTAVPFNIAVPPVSMGHNGIMGLAFGRCEALISAELWRIAPARKDGSGRWALPFAKSPSPFLQDHHKQPSALAEFKAANEAILRSVEKQVAELDQQQMAAASIATGEKDVA